MAAEPDLIAGTITLTNGSDEFTGVGTSWLLSGGRAGDMIIDLPGTPYQGVVKEITSDTAGLLTKPWDGPTLTSAYRYRFQPDGSRVPAEARNLIELLGNGNLQAAADLTGSANQVIMFTGPGAMTTISKAELTSGANYDVQVNALPDRDAYDGQAEGFSVLISDMGDGRSAITSRVTATTGVWSDPAYVTGPIGETPDVTIGTVTTGAPGTDAEVTATPTVDGVELDFVIPAGEGFVFEGAYDSGTAYALGDVVRDAGSSWIALQATTGNAPPTLPTISNAYWELMAQKGNDGAGTISALGEGDGISVDITDPEVPVISVVAFTGDSGSGGAIGGVPAPTAGDAAAGKVLGAGGSWVDAQAAGEVAVKTADYMVVAGDDGNVITVSASAAARTITLLPAATAGNGFKLIVKKSDSSTNTVTIDGNSSETIDGGLTKVLRLQNQSIALICDGIGWHVMSEGSTFERGSNANGVYVKFADGTMICTHRALANTTVTAAVGGVFRTGSSTWTFPAAFAAIPVFSVTESSGIGQCWGGLGSGAITTSAATFTIFNGTSQAVVPEASLIAIGRWF